MGDQWDGGPLGLADGGVRNEKGYQWDGGPVIWGTNEMGDQWAPIMYWGTNELGDQWEGDQWDGGPMRWGTDGLRTNEMGNQWAGGPMRWGTIGIGRWWGDEWKGGPMRWGTSDMGDQWDGGSMSSNNVLGDQWVGGPMRWGTNEMGDRWADPVMSPCHRNAQKHRQSELIKWTKVDITWPEIVINTKWSYLHRWNTLIVGNSSLISVPRLGTKDAFYCPACRTYEIARETWDVVICPICMCLNVYEFLFCLIFVYSPQYSFLFWIMYLLYHFGYLSIMKYEFC